MGSETGGCWDSAGSGDSPGSAVASGDSVGAFGFFWPDVADSFFGVGVADPAGMPTCLLMPFTDCTTHSRGWGGPANVTATMPAAATATVSTRSLQRGDGIAPRSAAKRACEGRGAMSGAPPSSAADSCRRMCLDRSRSGITDSTAPTWKMNARGLRSRKLAAPVRPQPTAELVASLGQACADCALGDALQARYLAVVVAVVVAEDEIRGHARGQRGQRLDDVRRRRGVAGVAAYRRPSEAAENLTDRPQLRAPPVRDRRVDRDLVQPPFWRAFGPEARPGAPGLDEGFLHAVFSRRRISCDRVERPQKPRVVLAIQAIEVVAIARAQCGAGGLPFRPHQFCQRLRPRVTCAPRRNYTRSARWQNTQSAWWDWRRWA